MIPKRDFYRDKDGNLTDDPHKYAAQVAVKGVFLDDRTAKRFGITDTLVSVDEPNAVRRVAKIETEPKPEPEPEEAEPVAVEADEESASPADEEEPKAEATQKPAAKKGAKKK